MSPPRVLPFSKLKRSNERIARTAFLSVLSGVLLELSAGAHFPEWNCAPDLFRRNNNELLHWS